MTQEEKQLLLKVLCEQLPYGVKVKNVKNNFDISTFNHNVEEIKILIDEYDIKPYLRPISSMTEEEKIVVRSMNAISETELNDRLKCQRMYVQNYTIETFDYFNEHKLDYRGLIPMGLAIEAPADMYKTK